MYVVPYESKTYITTKEVELKYKALSLTVYFGTMTGCTGGGHPIMQSYIHFVVKEKLWNLNNDRF